MTVPVQETRFSHTGNGVTTEFAYGCQIQSPSDLVVSVAGEVVTSGFIVNGVGASTGGSVAFTTPPQEGAEVLLERLIKLERVTDYQQMGDFLARVVNPDFDRVWMALQQFENTLGLAPGAAARVLKLGAWDGNGSGSYRAQNNRIQDLADPVNLQDAANKRWTLTQLAQTITDGAGNPLLQLLAAVDGASLVGFQQRGAGAIARTSEEKHWESVSVADFGAAGDGVADSYAAMAFAIGAGERIRIPAGTYRLPFSAVNALNIVANTVIEGDGKDNTTLIFVLDSSTYRNLFSLAAPLTLRNLQIRVECPAGGTLSFFAGDVSGLTADNCLLHGGMTNAGTALSHNAYMVNFPNVGTHTDITFSNCDITRFKYGILKTNAATSTQRRISYEHCDFYENYSDPCQFNSPSGVMDDIQVYACSFRDSLGTSAGLTALHCSFASATNFRVGLCSFAGPITDALHIEENSQNGSIAANQFDVDGNGITLQDNNIGGTALMPQHISISGNTLKKAGTFKEAGKYGISFISDVSAEVPAKTVTVFGNTAYGFDRGFDLQGTTPDDACEVSGNIADGCTVGFYQGYGSLSVHDNTSRNCTAGVYSSGGGVIESHRFINCPTSAVAVGRPLVLMNPMFMFPEFDNGAGVTTYKPLFPLAANTRVYGVAHTYAHCSAAVDYSSRSEEVTWDGATLTAAAKVAIQPGGLTTGHISNGGSLNVRIFTTASRTAVSINTRINGAVTLSV